MARLFVFAPSLSNIDCSFQTPTITTTTTQPAPSKSSSSYPPTSSALFSTATTAVLLSGLPISYHLFVITRFFVCRAAAVAATKFRASILTFHPWFLHWIKLDLLFERRRQPKYHKHPSIACQSLFQFSCRFLPILGPGSWLRLPILTPEKTISHSLNPANFMYPDPALDYA